MSSSHLLQDLDFNLRISGQERQEGGKSSKLSKDAALQQPCGGAWLSEDTVTQAGETILESTDPPGPKVDRKCGAIKADRTRISGYRLRSEGDRRAMAQDCARSCSGRTGTRTKR